MDGDRWPVEFFLSSSGLKMLLVEVQSEKSNKKTAFIIKQLSYLQLDRWMDRWILGLTVNAFMTFWHWCHMTVNGSDRFAMVYVVLMVQCGRSHSPCDGHWWQFAYWRLPNRGHGLLLVVLGSDHFATVYAVPSQHLRWMQSLGSVKKCWGEQNKLSGISLSGLLSMH